MDDQASTAGPAMTARSTMACATRVSAGSI